MKHAAVTFGLVLRRVAGIVALLCVAAFVVALMVEFWKREVDSSMISLLGVILLCVLGVVVHLVTRPLRR